jgi:hypothetical protein
MEAVEMKRLAILLLTAASLSGCSSRISGLMPVNPSPMNGKVDSLRPLLQWEAFRITDERVTDLVYDLEVLTEKGGVVYRRNGLQTPEHRLEQPLASKGTFRWHVRARFRWEGRRRETQWSSVVGGTGASPLGMLLVTP